MPSESNRSRSDCTRALRLRPRSALDLLERDAERAERVAKRHKAVGVTLRESRAVLLDFQPSSRLRRLD